MLSSLLKESTRHLHKQVESVSPLRMGLLKEIPEAESIFLFKEGMEGFWKYLALNSRGFNSSELIVRAFRNTYDAEVLPKPNAEVSLQWIGTAYVLLGSAMGSSVLLKEFAQRGVKELTYFEQTSALIPVFMEYKSLIDREQYTEKEVDEILLHAKMVFETLVEQWSLVKI